MYISSALLILIRNIIDGKGSSGVRIRVEINITLWKSGCCVPGDIHYWSQVDPDRLALRFSFNDLTVYAVLTLVLLNMQIGGWGGCPVFTR